MVQFVSYLIIAGIIAAAVEIFTFTEQFCIHPHLLRNIGADSCSCKAQESTLCEQPVGAIPFNYYIWLCYI